VLGHVRRLREARHFEPELVVTRPGAEQDAPGDLPVRTLAQAAREPYDVAVATWWQTAAALYEVPATRRCLFMQSAEHRFYADHELFERQGAAAVLGLPIDFITVAPWMSDLLSELRPEARCHVVPNGIDKAVFAPRERTAHQGPLRVLVEGQPSLWFKGVEDAVRAVRRMRLPHELTVACLDPHEAAGVDADRIVGALDQEGMAALYAETDVLVKLARVEGLGLGPLEALHMGVPCVVTPYTGHEEYLVHGENGLITGFDDVEGTAQRLDLLARDPDLRARLSAGALATAARWPDGGDATQAMVRALSAVATDVPPDESGLALLHRTAALSSTLGRVRLNAADGALTRIDELEQALRECQYAYGALSARLDEIQASKGYRALATGRRLVARVRP